MEHVPYKKGEEMHKKSNTENDYYAVLGVPKTATLDEIKQAYRALARKMHPDKDKNGKYKDRFELVNEAYQALSHPTKRAEYDAQSGLPMSATEILKGICATRWVDQVMPKVDGEARRGEDVMMSAQSNGDTVHINLRKQDIVLQAPEAKLQYCVLKNRGKPGKNGGPAGDVVIFVAKKEAE